MPWWRSSIDEDRRPGKPVEHLLVGQIGSAHGLKGEVSVKVSTQNPSRYAPGNKVWVGRDPHRAQSMGIQGFRSHSGRALIKFWGVEDRTEAELLRGLLIFVEPDQLPQLETDAYWEHELAGALVVDVRGAELGTLAGIEERFEQDLWTVQTPSGPVMVPAAKEIIVSVEPAAGRIVVDPPPGLFPEGRPSPLGNEP